MEGKSEQVPNVPSVILCSDCSASLGTIRRLRKYFCSPCWIHHCVFRFRKRLFEFGKPAKGVTLMYRDTDGSFVNAQENVLIYFDRSEGSRALLYLIREAVVSHAEAPESERLGNLPFPFTFTILYAYEGMDDNGVVKEDMTGARVDIEFLRSWSRDARETFSLHFPLIVTSLEKSLSSSETKSCGAEKVPLDWKEIGDYDETHSSSQDSSSSLFPFDPDLNRRLALVIQSLKSKTSRIDFLQCLRQNLIVSVTQSLGLSKILLPEDQTSMAVKMFSIMSLGRGAQLAEQMSLVTRIDGTDLARPMMDLSTDDLRDFLSSLDKMESGARIDKEKRKIDNIKTQCEGFIVTLQQDYPSTVPTLTKIGAKLQPSTLTESSQVQKCRLCRRLHDQVGQAELCYGCTSIFKESASPASFLELIS